MSQMEREEEMISGDYDSLESRVEGAFKEATGTSVHQAFDDAEATLGMLQSTYQEE